MINQNVVKMTAQYYDEKIKQHGATPSGVDWNGQASQYTRFNQLKRIISQDKDDSFSINDVGCGYGELILFLKEHFSNFDYCGYDVSKEMLEVAKEKFTLPGTSFHNTTQPKPADYTVASGIFNVRNQISDEEWFDYIIVQLNLFDSNSRMGFAANFLTKYSDSDKMRDYLYYTDPLQIFDYCKRNFSRNVALLHDYELYEFTILVRK